MGEIFFKRLFVLFLLVVGLFFVMYSIKDSELSSEGGITGMITHPLYPSFSSPESGFVFNNNTNLVSVADTVIYKMGYYSVNGSSWQSFNLAGTFYPSSTSWLTGSAIATLPIFSVGEHYVIIYSCSYVNNSWDCHENKWQLIVVNNTVSSQSNCSCQTGEYCSNNVCLLNVSGHTYFVAPNGNDNNLGTFSQPWKTPNKAVQMANAGDVVYFRGGTYNLNAQVFYGPGYANSGHDGTASAPINYFNYPEEKPIFDYIGMIPSGAGETSVAFYLYNVDYVNFRGLTTKNVKQVYDNVEAKGFYIYGCTHLNFTNMVFSDIEGGCSVTMESDQIYFYNSDAYNCWDPLNFVSGPGNSGFGFYSHSFTGGSVYYYNCRAWNASDQGFCTARYTNVTWDNCWSWDNGHLPYGAGMGWKFGFEETENESRTLTNCIATFNLESGFNTNGPSKAYSMHWYNNIAYHNGAGYTLYSTTSTDEIKLKRILRNNIAYANPGYNASVEYSLNRYTHDHNSWDISLGVSDADFVALPKTLAEAYSVLGAPRKADGSLPDLGGYFHLSPGSDLIDKGVNVGLPYSGSAPDLGPFEYVGTCTSNCTGKTCGSDGCGGSCGTCQSGEVCSAEAGICLLQVTGHTYFVATNGNDNNPGTFSQPWKTWGKAFSHSALTGGDIVYFRGGTYPMSITNGDGYRTIKSGSVGKDINYFNYPGEVPVLDCSNVIPSGTLNFGVYAWATNVHFKGLTIKNVVQTAADVEVQGWSMGGINITFENCIVHDCGGAGFWMANGINVSYINCDGYDNWDPLTAAKPGNDGYGFMNFNWVQYDGSTNGSVYYKNCRAWGNGDDGFSLTSDSPTEYDGCWSYNNGRLEGAGNGFKIGWDENNPMGQTNPHVKNSIATNNRASGITTNEDPVYYCSGKQVYNNLIYHNGYYPKSEWDSLVYGIIIYNTKDTDAHELLRIFRNNIAYDNQDGPFIAYPDSSRALSTHDHNTWDSNVTVNADDFISLDYNQLKAPRKADGSLPDITFGHLVAGSDLIDKGVNVGLPYSGSAPDLGPFEYP